jgi:hypothetical protein
MKTFFVGVFCAFTCFFMGACVHKMATTPVVRINRAEPLCTLSWKGTLFVKSNDPETCTQLMLIELVISQDFEEMKEAKCTL